MFDLATPLSQQVLAQGQKHQDHLGPVGFGSARKRGLLDNPQQAQARYLGRSRSNSKENSGIRVIKCALNKPRLGAGDQGQTGQIGSQALFSPGLRGSDNYLPAMSDPTFVLNGRTSPNQQQRGSQGNSPLLNSYSEENSARMRQPGLSQQQRGHLGGEQAPNEVDKRSRTRTQAALARDNRNPFTAAEDELMENPGPFTVTEDELMEKLEDAQIRLQEAEGDLMRMRVEKGSDREKLKDTQTRLREAEEDLMRMHVEKGNNRREKDVEPGDGHGTDIRAKLALVLTNKDNHKGWMVLQNGTLGLIEGEIKPGRDFDDDAWTLIKEHVANEAEEEAERILWEPRDVVFEGFSYKIGSLLINPYYLANSMCSGLWLGEQELCNIVSTRNKSFAEAIRAATNRARRSAKTSPILNTNQVLLPQSCSTKDHSGPQIFRQKEADTREFSKIDMFSEGPNARKHLPLIDWAQADTRNYFQNQGLPAASPPNFMSNNANNQFSMPPTEAGARDFYQNRLILPLSSSLTEAGTREFSENRLILPPSSENKGPQPAIRRNEEPVHQLQNPPIALPAPGLEQMECSEVPPGHTSEVRCVVCRAVCARCECALSTRRSVATLEEIGYARESWRWVNSLALADEQGSAERVQKLETDETSAFWNLDNPRSAVRELRDSRHWLRQKDVRNYPTAWRLLGNAIKKGSSAATFWLQIDQKLEWSARCIRRFNELIFKIQEGFGSELRTMESSIAEESPLSTENPVSLRRFVANMEGLISEAARDKTISYDINSKLVENSSARNQSDCIRKRFPVGGPVKDWLDRDFMDADSIHEVTKAISRYAKKLDLDPNNATRDWISEHEKLANKQKSGEDPNRKTYAAVVADGQVNKLCETCGKAHFGRCPLRPPTQTPTGDTSGKPQGKGICFSYKENEANSCRYGANCKFLHRNTDGSLSRNHINSPLSVTSKLVSQ